MIESNVKSIKNAKKEAQLFRELSQLFLRVTLDDPRVSGIHLNRVELSREGGTCYLMFYTPEGEEAFQQKLSILILYKPSLRKALAQSISARYTPDLVFKFDDKFEKLSRMEALLDKIKAD